MTGDNAFVRTHGTVPRLRTIRSSYDGQLPQWGSCWLVIRERDDPDQPMTYPAEMPLFDAAWAWCPS